VRFERAILAIGLLFLLWVAGNLLHTGRHRFAGGPAPQAYGSADNGRKVTAEKGCGACHIIPGLPGAAGRVGPNLTDIGSQTFLGGQLPNTPENLAAWVQNPQKYAPGTAMPTLGLTDQEARDVAAFLLEQD
jgi:cytochrome c1